jgi:hypothetical protein
VGDGRGFSRQRAAGASDLRRRILLSRFRSFVASASLRHSLHGPGWGPMLDLRPMGARRYTREQSGALDRLSFAPFKEAGRARVSLQRPILVTLKRVRLQVLGQARLDEVGTEQLIFAGPPKALGYEISISPTSNARATSAPTSDTVPPIFGHPRLPQRPALCTSSLVHRSAAGNGQLKVLHQSAAHRRDWLVRNRENGSHS